MGTDVKHFWRTIEGWFDYQSLYAWVVWDAPKPAVFVEVGAWKGSSAAFMGVEILNSGRLLRMDCVDHWRGSVEHQNNQSVIKGTLYDEFVANTAPVASVIRPKTGESVEVAKEYANGMLYFIFIDGSHDKPSLLADLEAWWPKLAPGGIMAGHDIWYDSVAQAVAEFFADKPVTWLALHDKCWSVRCER